MHVFLGFVGEISIIWEDKVVVEVSKGLIYMNAKFEKWPLNKEEGDKESLFL